MTAERDLLERLREGHGTLRALDSRGELSEDDTKRQLIEPLIEWLDYGQPYVRGEQTSNSNRPDYVLYAKPIPDGGPARVIAEAKPLGTDFDRVSSDDRTESPVRQAERYLRDHAAAAADTIGALTDGLCWRFYHRSEGTVAESERIDLGPLVREENDDGAPLERLRDLLARRPGRARGSAGERALRALAVAARAGAPDEALVVLGSTARPLEPIDTSQMHGRELDQVKIDWDSHARGPGQASALAEGEQVGFEPRRVGIGAVRFRSVPLGIGRVDAARAARIFAAQSSSRAAATFVWQTADEQGGAPASARLAVAVERRVVMTQPFDPDLPPPTARAATARLLALLSRARVDPRSLAAALDVLPLQRDFYGAIRAWVRRLRHNEAAFRAVRSRDERHEIVLRHLIRVLFVWILKEEGSIPPTLFERAFPEEHGISDYHQDVLRFLFHERLNKQDEDRAPHRIAAADEAFRAVPFLNGSLFAPRTGDERLRIGELGYWGGDEEPDGLFDILARYYWTADEQRPGEREQTLDPELLSNLFEQLLADPLIEEGELQEGDETLKAPDGAYYTPMDVTAEMAADALAAAVRDQTPTAISNIELLDLFRDPDAELPALRKLGRARKNQLVRRIEDLRIFDPATGSGAFLLAVLQALRTALERLRPDGPNPTRAIVANQLMGQDVNPMAAQIARLRLFVALEAAERTLDEREPLPNLEARIVCADTLWTHPAADYDAFARGSSSAPQGALIADDRRSELENSLRRLAAIRDEWASDHNETAKSERREQDEQARADLRDLLEGAALVGSADEELRALADYPLLELDHDRPALMDPRLLFARDEGHWPGFDVVIGNPPYQSFARSGLDGEEVRALRDRGYGTTAVSDIYALFCEAALALARPDGGVVTLVVPLSIAFGQQERVLRAVFEERCRSVSVRSYDNIPDTIFNQHPLFKGWKNKQRSSIVTAVRGQGPPPLQTDALLRWRVHDRAKALRRRPRLVLPDGSEIFGGQWPRIPNDAVQDMIAAIIGQEVSIGRLRRQADALCEANQLSLPPTGWYFVSALPTGTRNPARQVLLPLLDRETLLLAMAALNGHVAYGWWRVFGDGFDVKLSDYAEFTIPDAWLEGRGRARAIGLAEDLVEAIDRSQKAKLNAGQEWPNVDFFQQKELIAELDRFHIESLGLPVDPLLGQLRLMRSPDGWDLQ